MKFTIRHSIMTAALLTGAVALATPALAQTVNGSSGDQSSYSNFGKADSSASLSAQSNSNLSAQNNSKSAPMDSDRPQAEMEAIIAPNQNGSIGGNAGISSQSSFSNFGKVGSTPDVQ